MEVSEETVRSPAYCDHNGIASGIGDVLPVPFAPTVMAPKVAYCRGNREGGEEPVSKNQIRSGEEMGGATRSGTAEPTSRDQNTRQERGQGKGKKKKVIREEEINGAHTEAARQSRAASPATRKN